MTLLEKKCFVAAAGLHGLLVLILFVGPAFRNEPKAEAITPLTMIPSVLIDGPTTGGSSQGSPAPVPVTPTPPQVSASAPAPAPTPPPVKAVEPPKTVVEPPKAKPPEPVKVEEPETTPELPPTRPTERPTVHISKPPKNKVHTPTPPKKTQDIKIDLNAPDTSAEERKQAAAAAAKAEAKAAARAEANRIKHIQDAFGHASTELTSNIGNKTEGVGKLIQFTQGSGGNGPAAANYRDAIFSIYYNAWTPPDNVNDAHSETEAKVVVAKDGSIISATVTSRSGQTGLDKSVERTLKKVMQLPPFPAGTTDDRRTFIIIFNLKAKLEG